MQPTPSNPEPQSARSRRRFAFPKPALIEWFCLVGGLVLLMDYAWLLDDAYVYFRYADNLLYLGYGLVYNSGEYVEGYSSPLWMLLLIALRGVGLNFWIVTRLVGVLAFVVFWSLLVVLNRKMSPRPSPVLNFPLCYLTFNYGVLCYFTSGMETPLVQVAAVAFALFAVMPTSRALQISLALTPLVRHELALPLVIGVVWLWARQRRFPWRMVLASVAITGSWVVFRIYYYADLFPNTFYLKDMVDFAQGWRYLQDTALVYWLYPVLLLFAALALARKLRRRAESEEPDTGGDSQSLYFPQRALMLVLALCIAAYVVKIGGDARHFRYLAFPFCLCVCAGAGIFEHAFVTIKLPARRIMVPVAGLAIAVGLTACCYPRQCDVHPLLKKQRAATMVDGISDAVLFRAPIRFPRFELFPWDSGAKIDYREDYARFKRENPDRAYTEISIESKCAVNYKRFFSRVVHGLGLTDPILARTRMKADRPAHKFGLQPLATQLAAIIQESGIAWTGETPRESIFRAAAADPLTPPWMKANLDSIEVIERKMFNRHSFVENLRLAFTFPERIDPGPEPKRRKRRG